MELSWHQQRAMAIGAAALRSGKDVQHGMRNCDCCGDSTFGPFDDEHFKCSMCEDTDCDPAQTSHCFTGHCDGTGCGYYGACELRWDYEAEFTYERGDLAFEISKEGGGTVGQAYAGMWMYRVLRDGEPLYAGRDLRTGMPKTHVEAAVIGLECLEANHVIPELV
ncbi:hypothetical protein ACFTUC_17400 [Streptomyces sp. NPDC056944]|uniref:hypothetical protein n=1 Tax=Streptomyces sp. NPDC056944 TaxID=3345972 RepID=UPI003645E4D6